MEQYRQGKGMLYASVGYILVISGNMEQYRQGEGQPPFSSVNGMSTSTVKCLYC
jgi:hypothetical protein